MKKIIAVISLLLVIGFLPGCATMQSSSVKMAPKSSFTSLPKTIIIAPIGIKKGLKEEWRNFYVKMVGEEGFKEGREILYQIFQKEFSGSDLKILKETTESDYLLVQFEIGEYGLNVVMMVGTFGQYSKAVLTELKVLKMPESALLMNHKAQTVEHWFLWNRTLFYNSISTSGERVAKLLKTKLKKGE